MLENEKAKDFLAKRRSVSVKDLKEPGPGLENILEIMNAAFRVPCLLYTSPSPRDGLLSRMPSSA